jgi:voltage-gated potassium channel
VSANPVSTGAEPTGAVPTGAAPSSDASGGDASVGGATVGGAPVGGATPRRDRWEAATTIPLVILGFSFIVAYSVWVLVDDLSDVVVVILLLDFVLAWLAFLVDYIVRVSLTPRGQRWLFVRSNVVDLLSVLLPVFRAFRVVNLLRRVPYFQVRSGAAVRTTVITYAAVYAGIFVYFMALAALSAERNAPESTITNFGDAIWWACVTLATVGYGDTYPVTAMGRIYAVILMGGGVAIIGTASALVLSYITERIGRRLQ